MIEKDMWCPVSEIKWYFDLADLPYRRRLVSQIRQRRDPVSQYLWDQFSDDTKQLFDAVDGPFGWALVENPLIAAILSDLNNILERADLYEPARFAHVRSLNKATEFVGKTLGPDDQIRFNRQLLEAAYPDLIARSGSVKGLAAEIVHFFWDIHSMDDQGNPAPKTLEDFLNECSIYHHEQHADLGLEIRRFCSNLIGEGRLFSVGFNPQQRFPYSEQFISYFFIKAMAAYGSYEFIAFGVPKIREYFSNSVIKLIIAEGDREHIGTGFLMDDATIVTAAHCVPKGARVTVEGWDPIKAPLSRIVTFGDYGSSKPFVLQSSRIDVAILEFKCDVFPEAPKFQLWQESVLDNILVMGYPQLSGFQSGLIASKGEVISKEMSTARNQPMIIFSASVKGGNSGGPLLNRYGKVVGLVTNLSRGDRDVQRLGYGLATPARAISELRNLALGYNVKDKQLLPLPFECSDGVIVIK